MIDMVLDIFKIVGVCAILIPLWFTYVWCIMTAVNDI
jgi:hypothetical protein